MLLRTRATFSAESVPRTIESDCSEKITVQTKDLNTHFIRITNTKPYANQNVHIRYEKKFLACIDFSEFLQGFTHRVKTFMHKILLN